MQLTIKQQLPEGASAEDIFHTILVSRGYGDQPAQADFLNPAPPTLASLVAATGITRAKLTEVHSLIDVHLSAGHDICVFGDYDADGITATATLWQALIKYAEGNKSRILPFIPDRHRHGYGLSVKAVDEILAGDGFKTTKFSDFMPQLIITVDNGIVANEAISKLRASKVDVIITDHHEIDVLPDANVIVHTKATSGAGIAWIVALSLLEESEFAQKLIDLATIGIVADMMPLTDINRSLVVAGLQALSTTNRPGLRALYQTANFQDEKVSAYTISYMLAPRLNAAGRLADPYDALRLLCATGISSAQPLAQKINAHNVERQTMTDEAILKASRESSSHKIVLVRGQYHEGVIGLVAGKLTEVSGKPAIVMSVKDDVIKASARSVTGVNITELLRSLKVPFLSLGGHSQAAGFSLDPSKLNEFTQELYEVADTVILDEFLEKKLVVDTELNPQQVSLKLAKLLTQLEPFGMGNPKPKFLLKNLNVLEDRPLGVGGKHHKLILENGSGTLDLLLFNTKEKHPLQSVKTVVATIDVNVWNGRESVQLIGSYVEA
jgi:single-stranded-DNA-specific exonuclease